MNSLALKLQQRLDKGANRIIWAFDPYLDQDPIILFKEVFPLIKDDIAGIKFNRQVKALVVKGDITNQTSFRGKYERHVA